MGGGLGIVGTILLIVWLAACGDLVGIGLAPGR